MLSSDNSGVFTYDAPVLKCLGQPYVDSTTSGCTRVALDGLNLGLAVDSSALLPPLLPSWQPSSPSLVVVRLL